MYPLWGYSACGTHKILAVAEADHYFPPLAPEEPLEFFRSCGWKGLIAYPINNEPAGGVTGKGVACFVKGDDSAKVELVENLSQNYGATATWGLTAAIVDCRFGKGSTKSASPNCSLSRQGIANYVGPDPGGSSTPRGQQ